MDGTPAIYLGRLVSKENFRAFIYAPSGSTKLVETWVEFEAHMQTGVWFATIDDAKGSIAKPEEPEVLEKPRTRQRKEKKQEGVLNEVEKLLDEDDQKELPPEDAAFEVTDDFLPKG